MCAYARSRGKTPKALVTTGLAWMNEEVAKPWGGREWGLQLIKNGLLDQVANPEASMSARGN